MAEVLLLGGPCDQVRRAIDPATPLGGPYRCKGTDYWYQLGTERPYVYLAYGHVWVVLRSSVCDGEQRGLTKDQFKSGGLTCKGHLYINVIKDNRPWQNQYGAYIWQEARALEDSAAPHAAYSTQGAFTAMHKLLRSLGHYVPKQLDREQAALRRIRRAVR